MLKKIKPYLFRIILARKKMFLLAVLLIFGGFLVGVHQANAFLDIPYNMATMQLDALDFVDGIVKMLVFLALLVGESATFLFISANLLDWASSLPIGLDNNLVHTGWNFVLGITNVSFILIFLFIAVSYILKLERPGMKKALPKLLIIALLVNFSLLFVEMAADIAWIFQNSFKNAMFEDGGLAVMAMEPLKASAVSVIGVVTAIPLTYLALAVIPVPFLSVAGLVSIATLVLVGEGIFGMFSQTIILIIFNFIAGFIFLVYALIFLMRIGVFWLLAIAAPLALVSVILPQTEKFFQQWLKTILSWMLLGIVAFFLMGLGIKLFGEFAAPETTTPIKGLGNWSFFGGYYKYIFLFTYLVISLQAARKFTPIGTNVIWSWGSAIAMGGARLTAGFTRKQGRGIGAKWEKGRKETAERVAAKMEKGGKPTFGERLRMGAWVRKPDEALDVGLRAEAKEKSLREKILTEKKAEVLKNAPKDPEDRKNYLRAELLKEEARIKVKGVEIEGLTRSLDKMAAIMEILTKEGKIGETEERFITDAVKRGVDPDKILERRPDLAPKLGKTIAEIMDKMAPEDARKKVQKEAYQNSEVVFHILKDEPKFSDIERNGKAEIKKEIIDTLNASYQHLITSKPGEVTMLNNRINKISRSLKWPK